MAPPSGGQTRFRIFNNAAAFFGGTLVSRLIRFATALVIVRALTGEDYGRFSFVYVYLSFYEVFVQFGFNATLTREAARSPEHEARILGNAVLFRIFLCAAVLPLVIGLVRLLNYPVSVVNGVMLASFQLFLSLRDVYDVVYRVRLKMIYPSLWNIPKTLLALGLVAFAAFYRPSINTFILAYLTSGVLALATFAVYTRRFVRFDFRPDFPLIKRLIGESFPLLLSGYLTLIYYRTDVVMLSKMKTFLDVAYYSVVVRLTEALDLVAASLYVSIFPILSRAFHENRADFDRTVSKSLKSLILFGLPMALGGMVVAKELIVLLFGAEYLPSAVTLRILVWYTFFYFIGGLLANVLIACGKQKINACLSFTLVVLNIGLNAFLIPLYSYNGAALATVAVEIAAVTLLFLYTIRSSEIRLAMRWEELPILFILNGVFLAVLFTFHSIFKPSAFVSVPAGVLLYGLLLFAFQVVRWKQVTEYLSHWRQPKIDDREPESLQP